MATAAPQLGARSRAGCRTSAKCDWLREGSSRPNSCTSINICAQIAPITLVNSLLIVSIVVVQAGRKQIVAGLPLPTHGGQARHRQRHDDVDLVRVLQLVKRQPRLLSTITARLAARRMLASGYRTKLRQVIE